MESAIAFGLAHVLKSASGIGFRFCGVSIVLGTDRDMTTLVPFAYAFINASPILPVAPVITTIYSHQFYILD